MSDILCNPHVIVTDVTYKSLAHINGVKAGDEVLKVNDVPINSSNAWLAVVHLSQVNSVRLYLRRETTSNESVLLIVPLNCSIENIAKVLKPPHLQPSAVENVYSLGGVPNVYSLETPPIITALDSTQSPGPATDNMEKTPKWHSTDRVIIRGQNPRKLPNPHDVLDFSPKFSRNRVNASFSPKLSVEGGCSMVSGVQSMKTDESRERRNEESMEMDNDRAAVRDTGGQEDADYVKGLTSSLFRERERDKGEGGGNKLTDLPKSMDQAARAQAARVDQASIDQAARAQTAMAMDQAARVLSARVPLSPRLAPLSLPAPFFALPSPGLTGGPAPLSPHIKVVAQPCSPDTALEELLLLHRPRLVPHRPPPIIPAPPAWACPLQYPLDMERTPISLNLQSPRRGESMPLPVMTTSSEPGLRGGGHDRQRHATPWLISDENSFSNKITTSQHPSTCGSVATSVCVCVYMHSYILS